MTLAVYSQRVYNVYHALLSTPRYFDQPTRAVYATATSCKVGIATVYRALRCME